MFLFYFSPKLLLFQGHGAHRSETFSAGEVHPAGVAHSVSKILSFADCYAGFGTDQPGNTKRGKYHCAINLMFDWFVL